MQKKSRKATINKKRYSDLRRIYQDTFYQFVELHQIKRNIALAIFLFRGKKNHKNQSNITREKIYIKNLFLFFLLYPRYSPIFRGLTQSITIKMGRNTIKMGRNTIKMGRNTIRNNKVLL